MSNVNNLMPKICSLSAKHGGFGKINSVCKAVKIDISKETSILIAGSIVNASKLIAEHHKSEQQEKNLRKK